MAKRASYWILMVRRAAQQANAQYSLSVDQIATGAQGESTKVYHLCYVHRPMPTARHPLQGLWKGDYGPNGVQVVQIMYDFTGSAARLVATKVSPASQFSAFPSFCSTVEIEVFGFTGHLRQLCSCSSNGSSMQRFCCR